MGQNPKQLDLIQTKFVLYFTAPASTWLTVAVPVAAAVLIGWELRVPIPWNLSVRANMNIVSLQY
jgi:hypothetical protein